MSHHFGVMHGGKHGAAQESRHERDDGARERTSPQRQRRKDDDGNHWNDNGPRQTRPCNGLGHTEGLQHDC
jgi:hypothetical protein